MPLAVAAATLSYGCLSTSVTAPSWGSTAAAALSTPYEQQQQSISSQHSQALNQRGWPRTQPPHTNTEDIKGNNSTPITTEGPPSPSTSVTSGCYQQCTSDSVSKGQASSVSSTAPYPDLRKTRMCPNMTSKDGCAYSAEECRYAHSANELRFSYDRFYKVLPCAFYDKGKCRNGDYCRFAHGSKELRGRPAVTFAGNASAATGGNSGKRQSEDRSWSNNQPAAASTTLPTSADSVDHSMAGEETPAANITVPVGGKKQQSWRQDQQQTSAPAKTTVRLSPGSEESCNSSHRIMEMLTPLPTPGDQLSGGSSSTWTGADCSPTSKSILSSQSSYPGASSSGMATTTTGTVFFPSPEQPSSATVELDSDHSAATLPDEGQHHYQSLGQSPTGTAPNPITNDTLTNASGLPANTYYEMCLSMGRSQVLGGFFLSLNSVYTD